MKSREILKYGKLVCGVGIILTWIGRIVDVGYGYSIALIVFIIVELIIIAIDVALARKTDENQKE